MKFLRKMLKNVDKLEFLQYDYIHNINKNFEKDKINNSKTFRERSALVKTS